MTLKYETSPAISIAEWLIQAKLVMEEEPHSFHDVLKLRKNHKSIFQCIASCDSFAFPQYQCQVKPDSTANVIELSEKQ